MHLHQKPGRDPHRNLIRYQKKILQVKKLWLLNRSFFLKGKIHPVSEQGILKKYPENDMKTLDKTKTGDRSYGATTTFSNFMMKSWSSAPAGSEQDIMVSDTACPPAFIVPK